MFTILLHSSKTMRSAHGTQGGRSQEPALMHCAVSLGSYLATLSVEQLARAMQISPALAQKTLDTAKEWVDGKTGSLPAIDAFLGDIYSGLQVQSFSAADRTYANQHLYILSGLYGVVRALDSVKPYRLEMGYKLPGNVHNKGQLDVTNLYDFWGDTIAKELPHARTIINLSAKEYTKAVFPHFKHIEGLEDVTIISPKFLTYSAKKKEPVFVTVHAKIARGAFARWLIQERIEHTRDLTGFRDLGYVYSKELSTALEPVFVAKEFQGLGLSVRLTR